MQERQVTVGGKVHPLTEPFMVMATQNPVEQEGTYPLPEAQLDRFFFKLTVPYPSKAVLAEVVNRTTQGELATIKPVASAEDLLEARRITREVAVSPEVLDYALSLIVASHPDSEAPAQIAKKYVRYGSSPRGAQSLITAGKVFAMLEGRFNVSKENIQKAAKPVLRHRLLLNYESEADGVGSDQVIDGLIAFVNSGDRDPVQV
jgi:MoxR-like ATPase